MSRPADWSHEENARRLEDLTFMAATGEIPDRAAERLGITEKSLQKWCDRQDAQHLWAQLMANKHAPGHGARNGRVAVNVA